MRWLIVAMLMGFTVLGHFNRVSISVAGKERFIGPELLSKEQMGLVYSAFLLVYTLCMIPGGWFIDRTGPRAALTAMGLGFGFCVVLTGVVGWLHLPIAGLLIPLILVRGTAGAMSAPLHPGAARSVSVWLPLEQRATANGLVTAGALIGISISYPGFGWLMDRLDWPLAFVVSGATLMLFSLLWYWLATDGALAEQSSEHTDSAAESAVNAGVQIREQAVAIKDLLRMVRNRNLLFLTFSYAALSYFQYLFFYWIEFYFGEQLKLPDDHSRQAAFVVTMAMAAGMGIGGVVSDLLCQRLGRRRGSCMIAMFGMGASSVFAWLGISASETSSVVWLFSFALGSLGLCEGIFWTTAPHLEPQRGGLACAFLNTVGNAGGLLGPVCTPWIATHYGWIPAIGVACAVCGLGALLWIAIDPDPHITSTLADESPAESLRQDADAG